MNVTIEPYGYAPFTVVYTWRYTRYSIRTSYRTKDPSRVNIRDWCLTTSHSPGKLTPPSAICFIIGASASVITTAANAAAN